MTREELLKVYAYAGAVWSSFKLPNNALELKLQNEVWLNLLSEFDISTIFVSINEYARSNNFCNVVQIAENCRKYESLKNGTYINEDMILNEIKNAVSYSNSRENYEKLSPMAKNFVAGSYVLARWAMDESFNSVIVSNLRKEIARYLADERMREDIRRIQSLNDRTKINLIEKGDDKNGLD